MTTLDIIFNVALLAAFVLTMRVCYEAWQPKKYPKFHMVDQAKRWGYK